MFASKQDFDLLALACLCQCKMITDFLLSALECLCQSKMIAFFHLLALVCFHKCVTRYPSFCALWATGRYGVKESSENALLQKDIVLSIGRLAIIAVTYMVPPTKLVAQP